MPDIRPLLSTSGLLAALLLALVAGCGGAQAAPPVDPDHDRPVPASEPRAEVTLVLELEPAQGCEQRFDLALYEDRRIDLVQWDEARGDCAGRRVTIRYLSAKLDRQELIRRVRQLARRASLLEQP